MMHGARSTSQGWSDSSTEEGPIRTRSPPWGGGRKSAVAEDFPTTIDAAVRVLQGLIPDEEPAGRFREVRGRTCGRAEDAYLFGFGRSGGVYGHSTDAPRRSCLGGPHVQDNLGFKESGKSRKAHLPTSRVGSTPRSSRAPALRCSAEVLPGPSRDLPPSRCPTACCAAQTAQHPCLTLCPPTPTGKAMHRLGEPVSVSPRCPPPPTAGFSGRSAGGPAGGLGLAYSRGSYAAVNALANKPAGGNVVLVATCLVTLTLPSEQPGELRIVVAWSLRWSVAGCSGLCCWGYPGWKRLQAWRSVFHHAAAAPGAGTPAAQTTNAGCSVGMACPQASHRTEFCTRISAARFRK